MADFMFEDCYLPPLSTSLPLSSAWFVLSHNAGTGYLATPITTTTATSASSSSSSSSVLSKSGVSIPYAKNQVGSVYQQLQDGARALDIRPKLLRNGTVILQHDSIEIAVSVQQVLQDALQWCRENPTELVLWLPSHFVHQRKRQGQQANSNEDDENRNMVAVLSSIYQDYGVTYLHCSEVFGLTVGEVMELAALPGSSDDGNSGGGGGDGYLLALDGQDYYGTSCAKQNWVSSKIVTCYPNNRATAVAASCTSTRPSSSYATFHRLKEYINQSANNPATSYNSELGPPASLEKWPLNEVQALWQVDGHSVAWGLAHLSSIIQDNRKSDINARVVNWIYEDGLLETARQKGTSVLLAVDNVHLHGNALLSVLRTSCGQTDNEDACGRRVPPPLMNYRQVTAQQVAIALLALYGMASATYLAYHRPTAWITCWTRLQHIVKTETQACCTTTTTTTSSAPDARRPPLSVSHYYNQSDGDDLWMTTVASSTASSRRQQLLPSSSTTARMVD